MKKRTFINAGQFQIVIGNKVSEFFKDFIEAENILAYERILKDNKLIVFYNF